MKVIILAAFIAILTTVTAVAAIYQWEDDAGVIGFTDNKDNIPRKYRNTIRERNIPTTPAPRAVSTPAETSAAPGGPVSDTSETIGGYGMAGWQSRYRSLRSEIGVISVRIVENKNKLAQLKRQRAQYHKPSDRVAYADLAGIVQRDEANLRELQTRLSALETEADRLAVPREWRE